MKKNLKMNIDLALFDKEQISLSELVRIYPIANGIREVFEYINIANEKNNKHIVNENITEEVCVKTSDGKQKTWSGPQIIFNKGETSAFTPEALEVWKKISETHQKKLLKNVWCSNCADSTTIVDYTGNVQQGPLILNGFCEKCGHNVARVIENK